MEIKQLCDLFCGPARQEALRQLLDGRRRGTMVIDGLAGSASSVLFSRLPRRKQPYLIVASDLDEAGYIYNDLVQLTDESGKVLKQEIVTKRKK